GGRGSDTAARARAEAQKLVTDVRRAVNAEWDTLKRGDRTRNSLEASRGRLRGGGRGAADPRPGGGPEASGREPMAGDHVTIAHLGLTGDVVETSAGTATVRAGGGAGKGPPAALRRGGGGGG